MPALALTWAVGRDQECWHEKGGGPPSQECLKWGAGIPDLFRAGSYTLQVRAVLQTTWQGKQV